MRNIDQMNSKLPEFPESCWRESGNLPCFPKLDGDLNVDAVIIGGGITGITTAYLLANKGVKVALLETGKLLNGTTGHTTAKITAQHGLIYDEFIRNFGIKKAQLYYRANARALNFIQEIVEKNQICCDFKKQDAYIYAATSKFALELEREEQAYQLLGIDGDMTDTLPINLKIKNALVMKNQAQFNPVKYLAYLVRIIKEKGGLIFENTTAVNIKKGKQLGVLTDQGPCVNGKYILSCSHFPFYEGVGLYSTRLRADRSYVIAAKIKGKYPGGMYIKADQPPRSLRSALINGEEMVLIGGQSHKTGQGGDTSEHYKAVELFGEQTFGLESIAYRWSAQDLITLDKIPYIGSITSGQPNILVATGFRKWGMTTGTVAAELMSSIILGHTSPYKELYTPSRFHFYPNIKNFVIENTNVVCELVKGKCEVPTKEIGDLSNDEGALVNIRGQKKGAYRDKSGNVHIVDTTCTHIGCEVGWNDAERTWDCPCHGSRFSYTGEVVEGPAEKPLQKYNYDILDNLTSEDSGY